MGKLKARLVHKAQALRRLLSDHGAAWVVAFLSFRFIARRFVPAYEARARRGIAAWLAEGEGPVHVYLSPLDWRYPYQQRPQHLARGLAASGQRVVFVTPAIGYDRTLDTRTEMPNVLVTPHRAAAIDLCPRPVVHLLSTDASLDEALLDRIAALGGLVVYDYIDALDDALSSGPLTPDRRALHARLLANEQEAAIAVSADALLREVEAARTDRYALITNGADTACFMAARRSRQGLRADFGAVVDRGLPIAGYYGSFAGWFDYDLVNEFARRRPRYSVVALGPDLDGSRGRLDRTLDNLFVLPAMDYADLARHAVWFDVGLVPFLVNDITLATSPLKIFEYMALGKPTVSTDLPECRKYASVLTASTLPAFCAAVDRAMELGRDEAFIDRALAEARANAWTVKVETLLALIDSARAGRDGRRAWAVGRLVPAPANVRDVVSERPDAA